MREGTRNVVVGAASIFGLAALAGMLLAFGELDWLFAARYPVTVRLNSAGGLTSGSQVFLDGVRAGVVSEAFAKPEDPTHPVRVVAMIDREARVPGNAAVRVEAALLGGGASLWLTSPPLEPGQARVFLEPDGPAELTGEFRSLVQQVVTEMDSRMGPLIEGLRSFQELSDSYLAVGRNLTDLTRPQSAEDLAAGSAPNVHTAAVKLNAALDDAREALRLAREWLGDDALRHDVRSAVAKAATLIDTATQTMESLTQAARSVQADAGDLARRLAPVADQLSVTLEEVRRLTQLASSGRGTVAQLLNNPDLYNSLHDAAIRLERALAEAQLFIQKVKSQGIPIDW